MTDSPKRRVTVARVRAAADKLGKVAEAADFSALPAPVRKDILRAIELVDRSRGPVAAYVAGKESA